MSVVRCETSPPNRIPIGPLVSRMTFYLEMLQPHDRQRFLYLERISCILLIANATRTEPLIGNKVSLCMGSSSIGFGPFDSSY